MKNGEELNPELPSSPTDGIWFLCEPAEPPFPCIPEEAAFWYALERQMWAFYVEQAVTDEVEPLFRDKPSNGACDPETEY